MRYEVIDGSMGEGGGQILRTALALSAILGKPVKVVNIRAKRSKPGLQRQHLISVRAISQISSARVEGARLGSKEVVFIPGRVRGGKYFFDIGTAGSVTLVLQALIPVAVYSKDSVEIIIRGGTDVPWSPPIDYYRFVFLRILEKFGVESEIALRRRGHYPRGGGEIQFRMSKPPGQLSSVMLDKRGEVVRIEGLSHAVKLPSHVAERQARSAMEYLRGSLGKVPIYVEKEWYEVSRDPHLGPGSGIVLWAITERSILGGDALGAKGKPAEKVGEEAATKLVEDLNTNMALDRHASDMILVYSSLACGTSVIGGSRLTLHALTSIELIRIMIPEVNIAFLEGGEQDKPFILRIDGICLTR